MYLFLLTSHQHKQRTLTIVTSISVNKFSAFITTYFEKLLKIFVSGFENPIDTYLFLFTLNFTAN